ncbi:phage tail protein [Erwinia mallotivora]|uniref:phage tail protein n=1 Tax=Erwinia mallotivora TaxID=69222 RepID=UPI0021C220D7|nr:phage tail protein [Erwinia mallotivora]
MTTKYFALLTSQGAAKLANAAALGTKLQITEMAVGDGGGTLPTPDAAQTKLAGEKRRAPLNALTVDAANSSQIIAEQIIPESEGGFWIREIGLFDADGVLIAVANCAETYKPQLQEGSGRTQMVRMIIIVNSTSAVTLKIDPSVVLATRQYVDSTAIEAKSYADKALAAHLAAANPHAQYLQIASALAEIKDAGLAGTVLDNLGLKDAAKMGVATPAQMVAGTATNLLPSVSAVAGLFRKGPFSDSDYVRIPDVPGGLIVQWARIKSGSAGNYAWNYPTPFPGGRLTAWGMCHRTDVSGTDSPTISFDDVNDPSPKTLTNFNLRVNGVAGAYSGFVIALGY